MKDLLLRLVAAIPTGAVTTPRLLYTLASMLATPALTGTADAWAWVMMDGAASGIEWTLERAAAAALMSWAAVGTFALAKSLEPDPADAP
jgi:hypothetical protein